MADAPLPTPHRARTALLANLAAVLERCDEQMVPAVYRSLGAAFSATPTQLGYITLSRALVQALCSPIGGIAGGTASSLPPACPVLWNWRACGGVAPSSVPAPLPVSAQPLHRPPTPALPTAAPSPPCPAGHCLHRGRVVGCGCLLWSACTAAFAACNSLAAGVAVWGVNGLGLALVLPNTQARRAAAGLSSVFLCLAYSSTVQLRKGTCGTEPAGRRLRPHAPSVLAAVFAACRRVISLHSLICHRAIPLPPFTFTPSFIFTLPSFSPLPSPATWHLPPPAEPHRRPLLLGAARPRLWRAVPHRRPGGHAGGAVRHQHE